MENEAQRTSLYAPTRLSPVITASPLAGGYTNTDQSRTDQSRITEPGKELSVVAPQQLVQAEQTVQAGSDQLKGTSLLFIGSVNDPSIISTLSNYGNSFSNKGVSKVNTREGTSQAVRGAKMPTPRRSVQNSYYHPAPDTFGSDMPQRSTSTPAPRHSFAPQGRVYRRAKQRRRQRIIALAIVLTVVIIWITMFIVRH